MSAAPMSLTYGALILVQVLFGLWPVVGAGVLEEVSPRALVGFRTLLGAPLVFLLVPAARRPRPLSDLVALAGLGLLGIAANQLLYIEGLARAGAVNAVVLITFIPIVTLVVAVLLGRERLRLERSLGVALSSLGVLLLVGAERMDLSSDRLVGLLLILANTTCYAIYLVLAKSVVGRVGALTTVAWVFLFGALEALPFTAGPVLATDWTGLSPGTWVGLAFILAGPTVGTYFLNAFALKHADSSVVAVFIGIQPVVGGIAAWWMLGELMTARDVASATLIVLGVVVATTVARIRARRRAEGETRAG